MNVSLGLALLAGIASTLSPCVLPVLPTFLGWIGGIAARGEERRRVVLDRLLWFALALVLTFVALGAAAGSVGGLLRSQSWIIPLAGAVFVLWGLFLLGLFQLPGFRVRVPRAPQAGRWGAVGFGLVFTLSWTPCIGPIYGTILTLAAATGSAGRGAGLLFAYALGLALPFFALGLAADRALRFFRRFAGFQRAFRIGAGVFILLVGIALLTGTYGHAIGWLNLRFADYLPPLA